MQPNVKDCPIIGRQLEVGHRGPLTSSTSNWYFSPQAIFLGKFVSTQNNHYYYPHPYHDYHADCGQVQGSQGKERKGIVAGSFKELVEKGECQCHDYEDDSGSDLKKVNVMTEIIINITLIVMMMMRIMLIVLIIIKRTMM